MMFSNTCVLVKLIKLTQTFISCKSKIILLDGL